MQGEGEMKYQLLSVQTSLIHSAEASLIDLEGVLAEVGLAKWRAVGEDDSPGAADGREVQSGCRTSLDSVLLLFRIVFCFLSLCHTGH
jgi:hypothetical protein